MLKYFNTPTGYFANLYGERGCMDATIHRPEKGRKEWRLCYATCTGEAKELQGKVKDFVSLSALKDALKTHDEHLNQMPENRPTMRG